jgi:chromosome partitioning protein
VSRYYITRPRFLWISKANFNSSNHFQYRVRNFNNATPSRFIEGNHAVCNCDVEASAMISFATVQYKGGSGKSTAALHLAVAAITRRLKVALIDVDEQRSIAKWAARRNLKAPLVIALDPSEVSHWLGEFGADHDLCIVDTPGHDWKALSCAVASVDFTLVVSRPATLDLEMAIEVRNVLHRFGLKHATLITQAPPRMSGKLQRWLDGYASQSDIVSTTLASLTAYQDAITLGLGVHEYEPHGRAAAEVNAVLDWLIRHIGTTDVKTDQCQGTRGSHPEDRRIRLSGDRL